MPNNESNENTVSSIIARMNEISSVRYLRSEDNMTKEQRREAEEMELIAASERHNRLNGQPMKPELWPEAVPESWAYAWAASPFSDVYYDLLKTMEAHGSKDRPRLPGVTLAHVERRERFLNSVLAERLEEIKAQKTERERVR